MRPIRIAVLVWVALGLVMIVAEGGDITDSPDWGQGLIFAVPVVAAIAVVVTGVVLFLAALIDRLDLEFGDLWSAFLISLPLAPIAAIVVAFALSGVAEAVPLLLEHFGEGVLLWLGLWWPVTIGAGLPLALVWAMVRREKALTTRWNAEYAASRGGPSGSGSDNPGGGASVRRAHAESDVDPTVVRALARPLSGALGPRGARRPLAIRILLGFTVALVLVPAIWLWALWTLVSRGRGQSIFDTLTTLDDRAERSSPGVNSMVQLLSLAVPTSRELVLGKRVPAARSSPLRVDDAGDRHEMAEHTFALYRRELGIEDPAVLALLALIAAYSLAAVVSALVGLILGGQMLFAGSVLREPHPVVASLVFGLLAPIASFAVWLGVALAADRLGRRAGDYSLIAVAILVPIGLLVLAARWGV